MDVQSYFRSLTTELPVLTTAVRDGWLANLQLRLPKLKREERTRIPVYIPAEFLVDFAKDLLKKRRSLHSAELNCTSAFDQLAQYVLGRWLA